MSEQKGLRFPCECVSNSAGGYSDPWAEVTKRKLLPNGTKEQILTLVAREPKTISQLAGALKLSAPSVHTHVNDMLKSELLRESEEFEKKHPTERYYEPNFPVFKAEECAEFRGLCEEMAEQFATLLSVGAPKSNARLLKRLSRITVGSFPISLTAWMPTCIAVRASCSRSAGCLPLERNTRTAPNGSSGLKNRNNELLPRLLVQRIQREQIQH